MGRVGIAAPTLLVLFFVFACSDVSGPDRVAELTLQRSLVSDTAFGLGGLGGSSSLAFDVNSDSVVVGRANTGLTGVGFHAFRVKWDPDSIPVDLTPGSFSSRAAALSDSGWIAGQLQSTSSAPIRAVTWGPEGTLRILDNLPGGVEASAFGVNNLGASVGVADLPGEFDITSHAAMWSANGAVTDLGTLGGFASEAQGINDSGVVVGSSNDAAGNFRAFVWSVGTGMQPLPTPFGGSSFANAINNSGDIVGGMTVGPGQTHAVLWKSDGQVVVLGSLGGSFAQAHDIDELGRVVGESRDAFNQTRAFVWTEDDGMEDLGAPVGVATAISKVGLVAGYAPPTGFSQATLWVLEDEDVPVVRITPTAGDALEVHPSGTGGVSELSFTVGVYDNQGSPLSERIVNLTLEATEGTAGHGHAGDKDPGSLSLDPDEPDEIDTGPSGEVQVTYIAPEAAGPVVIRATSDGAEGDVKQIEVRIPGLVELAETANLDRIGAVPQHPDSHWGTGTLVEDIQLLADSIRGAFDRFEANPAERPSGRFPASLAVNDMSLPLGGLFDLRQDWRPPHHEHRIGRNADIDVRRGGDDDAYADYVTYIWVTKLGHSLLDERESANHYHLRQQRD